MVHPQVVGAVVRPQEAAAVGGPGWSLAARCAEPLAPVVYVRDARAQVAGPGAVVVAVMRGAGPLCAQGCATA